MDKMSIRKNENEKKKPLKKGRKQLKEEKTEGNKQSIIYTQRKKETNKEKDTEG